MNKSTRFLRFFIFFMVLAMGCKNGTTNSSNVLTVRLPSHPDYLNPLLSVQVGAMQVMNQIFLPLLDFDPKSQELKPVLAKDRPEAVKIDTGKYKGGISYTYEIMEEAKWDNGAPVTANDYLFTIKTVFVPQAGTDQYQSNLDFIEDITIDSTNPRKFTIWTAKPYINAESSSGSIKVLPEYIYDTARVMQRYTILQLKNKDSLASLLKDKLLNSFAERFKSPTFTRSPKGVVGCGAYSLVEWADKGKIILTKKQSWWGDRFTSVNKMLKALPNGITYIPVSDEKGAAAMLKTGELDVLYRIAPQLFTELRDDASLRPNYTFVSVSTLSVGLIMLNTKSPELVDKRTRKALFHLLDANQIIKTVMNSFAVPCQNPFTPNREYFNKSIPIPRLDIEKAQKLLADAGWKDSNGNGILDKLINGKRVELKLNCSYPNTNNAIFKNITLMLQQNAQKAGVLIEPTVSESSAFAEKIRKRDFDLIFRTYNLDPNLDDPKQLWSRSSDTPNGGNISGFGSAATDTLIEAIRTELDAEKRKQLYMNFQAIMHEEMPALFLLSSKDRVIISKRFDYESIDRSPGFIEGRFRLKK